MYQTSAQFQSLVNQDSVLRRIIPAMSVIEHLPRNISTHAAGVILSLSLIHISITIDAFLATVESALGDLH